MSFADGTTEWMNPPPPGTSDDNLCNSKERYSTNDKYETKRDVKRHSQSPSRSYNDGYSSHHSRSRSHERYSKHHRDRHRRSRSRDHRRYRSRSGSRKSYIDKRYSHKSHRSRHSRSRSRSHSKRHRKSYSRSRSPSERRKRSPRSRSYSSSSNSDRDSYSRRRKIVDNQEYTKKVFSTHVEDMDMDDEEELDQVQENTFKNDGSFLEMFKKMQEEQAKEVKIEPVEAGVSEVKKQPIFGKRRGGRILKTGVVQKLKNPNESEEEPKDAWSVYMKEVRKYKEACCDDDSKTRPLVK